MVVVQHVDNSSASNLKNCLERSDNFWIDKLKIKDLRIY